MDHAIQPALFEHGIETENADIRCHVAPGTQRIFVFESRRFLTELDWKAYPLVKFREERFEFTVTAEGHLVPIDVIPGIQMVNWNSVPWWERFDEGMTTSEKGKHAEDVVRELAAVGRLPLWPKVRVVDDLAEQRAGTDLVASGEWRIQVKCDWKAGPRSLGGSGNLFIQTAERNPLRKY